jgi:hypothetical protein
MKILSKLAFGAAMLAGAGAMSVATGAPAEARVSVGIGIGGPVYYGGYYGPRYSYSCDPYSRWYDPYRCGGYAYCPAYYRPYYYGGPSFYIGGSWGGHHYRGGHWGGHYRGGHHGGHGHHR